MSTDVHEHIPTPSVNGDDDPETVAAAAEFCRVLTDNPVMLLDMLIGALRRAKEAAEAKPLPYYFFFNPDAEELTMTKVDSEAAMFALWREADQRPGQAIGVEGKIYLPTKRGGYVRCPDGRLVPLFAADPDGEVDLQGHTSAVVPILQPVAAHAATAIPEDPPPDEGDDDDDVDDEGADDEEIDEDDEDA